MTAQYKALPKTYILSPLSCFSKKRLFEEICTLAAHVTHLDEAYLMRALNERESWGSTMCANAVGLPHAVIPELDQSMAILAILPEDISYNTVDSDYEGVNVTFAFFFSPKDSYEVDAEMLRLFSSVLRNPDLVNSFRRIWQDQDKIELLLKKVDLIIYKDLFPEQAAAEELAAKVAEEQARLLAAQAEAQRIFAEQIAEEQEKAQKDEARRQALQAQAEAEARTAAAAAAVLTAEESETPADAESASETQADTSPAVDNAKESALDATDTPTETTEANPEDTLLEAKITTEPTEATTPALDDMAEFVELMESSTVKESETATEKASVEPQSEPTENLEKEPKEQV